MITRYCVIVTVFSLSNLVSQPAHANFVMNGGFETGDLTDWNYTSVDRYSFVASGFSHSGDYAAWLGDLQADGGGSISQLLPTTAGQQYNLSFWFAGNGDNPSGFTASVGGNVLLSLTNPVFDPDYNLYSYNFTATDSTTLLKFAFYDDPYFVNLDDVSVEPLGSSIPEPNSTTLIAIGLVTLAGCSVYRGRRLQQPC